MPLFAFIRLVVRLFTTASSLKEQYKEESEDFDAKHQISAPQSKFLSHVVVGAKIIFISLLMGDFEFLGEFSPSKFMDLSGILFIGLFIFLFIAIIMIPCEKQNQRNEKIAEEQTEFKRSESRKVIKRRRFRRNSKSIHDLGM